jgi:cell division protein FtsB
MTESDKSQGNSEEPLRQYIAVLNLRINDMMVQLNAVMRVLTEENSALRKEIHDLKSDKKQ